MGNQNEKARRTFSLVLLVNNTSLRKKSKEKDVKNDK
jgi:hypothetical protein